MAIHQPDASIGIWYLSFNTPKTPKKGEVP
jgi:hypothetical protein